MKKQWAMIVLAVIVFSLTTDRSDAAQKRSRRPTVSRKPRVSELRSVEGFKAAFQNSKGKVRLVALVSPT